MKNLRCRLITCAACFSAPASKGKPQSQPMHHVTHQTPFDSTPCQLQINTLSRLQNVGYVIHVVDCVTADKVSLSSRPHSSTGRASHCSLTCGLHRSNSTEHTLEHRASDAYFGGGGGGARLAGGAAGMPLATLPPLPDTRLLSGPTGAGRLGTAPPGPIDVRASPACDTTLAFEDWLCSRPCGAAGSVLGRPRWDRGTGGRSSGM